MAEQLQRRACNRCHGQKLRCRRANLGSSCLRCLKAGADCVFGLSMRTRKPMLRHTSNPPESEYVISQQPGSEWTSMVGDVPVPPAQVRG